MPDLTVGFWNLQNYGTENARTRWVRGIASLQGAGIIAALVRALGIDVLMVMEVMPNAGPSLDSLRNALNAEEDPMDPTWCYDWIRGAHGAEGEAQRRDDLVFKSGGSRREGYAVYWRSGDRRFTMVKSYFPVSNEVSKDPRNAHQVPAHCLALVGQGRLLGPLPDGSIGLRTGYNPARNPLCPFDENNQEHVWDDLPFMSAGKLDSCTAPRMKRSRRPAYCVISLSGNHPPSDQQIPIIAYHAPSYLPLAARGTWISGLGRQLAVTRGLDAGGHPTDDWIRCNKVIAAGDYNFPLSVDQWPFTSYTNQYGDTVSQVGVECGQMDPVPTTVQLNHRGPTGLYNGDPIASANPADYYHSAIDRLFFRGLADPVAGRPDVISMLRNNQAYAGGIKAWESVFQAASVQPGVRFTQDGNPYTHLDRRGRPVLFFPGIGNFAEFRRQVGQGVFTNARQAAEFLRLFVSDHLPVLVTFTV